MKNISTRIFSHVNLEKKMSDKDWSKPLPLETVISSSPKRIHTYDELVANVAKILYYNRNLTLYYRGQNKDYKEEGKTVIYPTIYRKKEKENLMLKKRFESLNKKSKELKECLKSNLNGILGKRILNKYPEICWSILQHYEKCPTPLLDLTQSLHVACSFACLGNKEATGVVYVLGMPWQSDALGYNSYEEIVNIRLLNVCPPQAQRPFFQEGYLAGPFPNYQLDNPQRRNQFDFSRRLIAKFEISNDKFFWGDGFDCIPQKKLYPEKDLALKFFEDIR